MARFFIHDTEEITINTDKLLIVRAFTDESTEVVFEGGEVHRYDEPYSSLLNRLILNESK